jgi:iron complex outermembrane recepter protein
MFKNARVGIRKMAIPLFGIGSAAAGFAGAADTQNIPETTSQGNSIDEIVVTAQRRSERAEDVPMTVQAISGDQLVKTGTVTFDDLQKIAPGVQISRIGEFTQPSIRGISTSVLGAGEENNVATYIDGFYQADQLALSGDLVNLSDVEILKGPQGALYGRNATGGAILINTLDPSNTFDAKVQATYGRFNDRGGQAYLNVPIASNVAFNLSLNYRENDGYIRDVTGVYVGNYAANTDIAPYYSYGARAKLKVDLTDNLVITLGYNYKFFSDPSATASYFSQYNVFPIPRGDGVDRVSQSIPAIYTSTSNSPTAKIEFHAPVGTLTSHTSYSRLAVDFANDYDGIKPDIVQAGATLWTRETFQETLDYNVTLGRLNLLTGFDYLRDAGLGTSWTKIDGTLANSAKNEMRTSAYAMYVNGTYSLTDRLFLSGGVRYSDEDKKFTSVFDTGPNMGESLFPGNLDEKTFVNFSPSATLRYQVAPNSNVYGSISRGFKSGTFNTINTVASTTPPAPVQPELVTAYEVGFKTNKDPVRIETAAYFYDYKDLQVSSTTIEESIITAVLQNAATAHIYGVEASLEYSPTQNWNLRGGAAFNHARYVSYPSAQAAVLVGGFITQGSQNWSGLPLPRAPDWTANLTSDYTIPLGQSKLDLTLTETYTSSYVPVSDSYDPTSRALLFQQSGYALTNGSLTWTAPGDHLWLSLYSNDMFNGRYKIYYNYSVFGAYNVLNQPVTYGVRVGYNY